MKICSFCKKRNNSKLPECEDNACQLCKGASAKLEKLIEEAAGKIPNDWKIFAISTNIPRAIMAAEENIWDYGIGESIKNDFNRRIAYGLEKKIGLEYNFQEADGKIIFDIGKNEVRVENSDVFIFGRYKKFRTDLAQSEWTCRDCNGKGCETCDFEGVKYESVEVILGSAAKEIYGAKDAELHASGREDVDALNFAGRPFVLELRKQKNGKIELGVLQEKINKSEEGVEISDLRYVSNSAVALVSDSHFDKAYEAEVDVEGGISKEDEEKILALKDAVLEQRTPNRVMHRRTDLVRKRKILYLRVNTEPATRNMKLFVLAEAGTYIKEFISGDDGRTTPSVSSALNKKAKCIKLSVVEIHDDFLDDILGG